MGLSVLMSEVKSTDSKVKLNLACVQTSPISFVARGKGPFSACNKGNRRCLHEGKVKSSHQMLVRSSDQIYNLFSPIDP